MVHSILQDGQLPIKMFSIPGWIWILTAVILGVLSTGSLITYSKRHALFTMGKNLFAM